MRPALHVAVTAVTFQLHHLHRCTPQSHLRLWQHIHWNSMQFIIIIHPSIHAFISFDRTQVTYIKTSKINVPKVSHRTERPVALTLTTARTDAHTHTNTKHKANDETHVRR